MLHLLFFFLVKRNTSHFDTHSHVKKGINQKRSVCFSWLGITESLFIYFFSVKAHSSVCRMLKGTWHIILGEKVHAWSTQISLFSTSFIPYQAVSSVCMWLFKKNFIFRFIAASLACILVRLLSNAHPVSVRVASRKKKKNHKWHKAAVVQRNKENLCWLFFFLPALAKGWWPLNNLNLCEYSK